MQELIILDGEGNKRKIPTQNIAQAINALGNPQELTVFDTEGAKRQVPTESLLSLVPKDNQTQPSPEQKDIGALGAFGKSAARAPFSMGENLLDTLSGHKFDLTPNVLKSSQAEQDHPIASFLGEVTGSLPPLLATGMAGRALIPALGRLAQYEAPTILGKIASRGLLGLTEGGIASGLFTPREGKISSVGEGMAAGALLYNIFPAMAEGLKKAGSLSKINRYPELKKFFKQKKEQSQAKRQATEDIEEQVDAAQDLYTQAKRQATEDIGDISPEQITRRKKRLEQATQAAESRKSEPYKAPPEPTKPEIPEPYEFTEQVPEAESLFKTQAQKFEQQAQKLEQELGIGEKIHTEEFASRAKEHKAKIEANSKKGYNELSQELTERPSKNINKIMKAKKKLNELGLDLNVDEKKISTRQLLADYRDARDTVHNLKQFSKGVQSDNERTAIFKQIDEINALKDELLGYLKSSMTKKQAKKLAELNEEFSETIIPMREHKVWRQIDKEGYVGKDALKTLLGDAKGVKVLQKMVESDPQLAKSAIADKLNKATDLLKKEPLREKFTPPEVKSEIEKLRQFETEMNTARENLDNAIQADKPQHAKAKEVEKEITKLKKDYDKQYEKYLQDVESGKVKHQQKAEQAHQKQLKYLEEMNSLNKHYDNLLEKRTNLEDLKKQQKISLKEKVKAEREFKEAEKELKEVQKKIKNLSQKIISYTAWGVGYAKLKNRDRL